jgi:hypothetical protein
MLAQAAASVANELDGGAGLHPCKPASASAEHPRGWNTQRPALT